MAEDAPAALFSRIADGDLAFDILLPAADTDYIQNRLRAEAEPYERDMLVDMRARLSRDALVLDVGANIGNHTLYLAASGLRVEAFEPNPDLTAPLAESVRQNGFGGRVRVHGLGIGAQGAQARFARAMPENLGGQALHVGAGGIEVAALDALAIAPPVGALKIDVEGMELDVLAGAETLIGRDRPLLYIESATAGDFEAIAARLTALEYLCWTRFNATSTHLFRPAETVARAELLPAMAASHARSSYAHPAETAALRRDLHAANVKYREALQELRALKDRVKAETVERGAQRDMTRLLSDLRRAQNRREPPPRETVLPAPTIPQRVALRPAEAPSFAASPLRVAAILDDFSRLCFAPEAELCPLTPEGWRGEVEASGPELLLVESAWQGKDGLWAGKITPRSAELTALLAHCRANAIPTAFWNKEDPVHFENFLATAHEFDHVFTTDIDCVARYRTALGHDRVHFLPFAAQTARDNPVETFARKPAVSFAGAYYARYPDRARALESFLAELPAVRPVEIFDRNFGKDDTRYSFPARFADRIVGSLPPERIDYAYKGYEAAINLNSVTASQSMFARRVFELLACNTLVISNYSRGMRLMFGDLVLAADDGGQVRARLAALTGDPARRDRLRLAGLRKVLSEHTYADRMARIGAAVLGRKAPDPVPPVTVLAVAADAGTAARLVALFRAQSLARKHLVLVAPAEALPEPAADITRIAPEAAAARTARELAAPGGWIAAFHADDHYGASYLTDLALATRYTSASLIGKRAHFVWDAGAGARRGVAPIRAYRPMTACAARRALVRAAALPDTSLGDLLAGLGELHWCAEAGQASDMWNYCAGGAAVPAEALAEMEDLPGLDTGYSLAELATVTRVPLPPAEAAAAGRPGFGAADLAARFAKAKAKQVTLDTEDGRFVLRSELDYQAHEYLHAPKHLAPDEVRGAPGEPLGLYVDATPGLRLSVALVSFDAAGTKVGQSILPAGGNVTAELPEDAHGIRFSFRVQGPGTAEVRAVDFAHRDLTPPAVLARSDCLILTNHYPAYDNLYRNAFIHRRVKAYHDHGLRPEVFRLRPGAPLRFSEFDGVDVMTGDGAALDRLLAGGAIRTVCVHFLDAAMWAVLEPYLDRLRVIVWVHGSEIQPWWRRAFEFARLDAAQIARQKEESAARMAFWDGVLADLHPNLHFVFVSQYFADEVMEDQERTLPSSAYSIIHNPIDTTMFAHVAKSPDMRRRILSIRPYASLKYANDLTVQAILHLADQPFFEDLEFCLAGDGPLFDETVAPLRGLSNVKFKRGFLTQPEIARLHKKYGVFLSPSRMDSQGVSRDEAMSSGLVPITTDITAIPEFVDAGCGRLTPPEDSRALADAIAELYHNSERFLQLSNAAASHVRRKSATAIIVEKDLALLECLN